MKAVSMDLEIETLADQGGRSYNEDTHGIWRNDRYLLCLVADGAGGHGGGDVAAATVRDSVLVGYARAPILDGVLLRGLLEQANQAVLARQAEGGKLASMRSTVVAVALDLEQNLFVSAHSGDSRAYLFRGGIPIAQTVDHSLVQQLVSSGMIDEEAARVHPRRNLLLTALGSPVDALEITVSAPTRITTGDVLLLCSDGVWEPLGNTCLSDTLRAARTPADWLAQLKTHIQALARDGQDNYTAIAIWTGVEDETTVLLPLPRASTVNSTMKVIMNASLVRCDPEVMSGALCFAGTRVPVKHLFDYLEGSSSLEAFLENFSSVSGEHAVAVLEAASERLAADAPVA